MYDFRYPISKPRAVYDSLFVGIELFFSPRQLKYVCVYMRVCVCVCVCVCVMCRMRPIGACSGRVSTAPCCVCRSSCTYSTSCSRRPSTEWIPAAGPKKGSWTSRTSRSMRYESATDVRRSSSMYLIYIYIYIYVCVCVCVVCVYIFVFVYVCMYV